MTMLPTTDPNPSSSPVRSIKLTTRHRIFITLVLAVLLWLPRGLSLDQFVAVDERSWMTRSGNFYLALSQGDLASTYQYYHPGVTTMWIGAAAYLLQYPDYPADATGQVRNMSEGIEDRLVAHGHSPLDILATARALMVLITVALLLVAFWLAVDLLGFLPALIGILLLGIDPLTLGLTRMLHVDGLSSTLMLVSVLAMMRFYAPDTPIAGNRRDLLLSAIAAGFAWLTKSPSLFLGPMVVVIALVALGRVWRADRTQFMPALWQAVRMLALWGAIAAAIFVAFWPSMWVRPLANIQSILTAAGEYAEESNQKIFFNGEIILDDPGILFYPITYAWHVTPSTLIGLVLALIAGVIGWRKRSALWQNSALLLLYAALFTLFMTFGSKKIDRYLLPAYFPLALVAGVGWVMVARVASERTEGMRFHGLTRWILPFALAAHAALVLPHFPYYFTYYNPLLGGNTRADQVLMIGLGEGIDQAARYLNTKPDAENLRVASWYRGGSFNYIFRGKSLNLDKFYEADYAVLYIHQWQRQVPDAQMLHYFAQLTPEYIVRLQGLDYAWVYDLRNAPTPPYFTDWAEAIRLTDTEVPRTSLNPGQEFLVNFYLRTIGTVESNLSTIVRLVDAAGAEVARSEGWPYGAATSTWQVGEDYVDGHKLTLPDDVAVGYLRVELGFFDGNTQTLIPGMVAGTDTPRGEFVSVGYVGVGLTGKQPSLLKQPPLLGDQVKLIGASLQDASLADNTVPSITAAPNLNLTLAWQPTRPMDADYVTLVHLIAPDGTAAKQFDRAPLQGVAPTTLWQESDVLIDSYNLEIPADLPPGDYQLLVGLYELSTLMRLPVTVDNLSAGDTVHVATITVP